jgi:hypothetical protein
MECSFECHQLKRVQYWMPSIHWEFNIECHQCKREPRWMSSFRLKCNNQQTSLVERSWILNVINSWEVCFQPWITSFSLRKFNTECHKLKEVQYWMSSDKEMKIECHQFVVSSILNVASSWEFSIKCYQFKGVQYWMSKICPHSRESSDLGRLDLEMRYTDLKMANETVLFIFVLF